MPSDQKNILLLPAVFFLDTNILDALPETLETGELSGFVSEVNKFHFKVYLPDVVAREWIQHRIDKVVEKYDKLITNSNYLRKYIDFIPDFKLGDEIVLSDIVRRKSIQRIKNAGLRIRKPPYIETRLITRNAVQEREPFAESNKGFKDELIILSILDIVEKWSYKSCVLITKNTKDFIEAAIVPRFKSFNTEFKVVDSLNAAKQLVIDTLDEGSREYYGRIVEDTTEYAKSHWDEISRSITEKVNSEGIFESTYGKSTVGTLKRIISIKPLKVKTALPGDEDSGTGLIPITISVEVELELEYEQMEIDWTEILGRKIKIIEEKKEYKPLQYTRVTSYRNVDVTVEAKAIFKDEKWEGFEISEVRSIFV